MEVVTDHLFHRSAGALAELVLDRRLSLRLSQPILAKEAGVGLSTIQVMERGNQGGFRLSTLRSVSSALGWADTALEDYQQSGAMPEPLTASVPDQVTSGPEPGSSVGTLIDAVDKLTSALDATANAYETSAARNDLTDRQRHTIRLALEDLSETAIQFSQRCNRIADLFA